MQTLGMFYADEIIYIFDSPARDRPPELLRIPRIPVDIDSAAVEVMRANLPLFRRLGAAGGVCPRGEIAAGIPEAFFYQVGDEVELSPWGQVVWQQARGKLYSEKLLDSPDGLIRYSKKFLDSAKECTPEQLYNINERLDDLARYLRDNGKSLARLDYKPLRGRPAPPSTHEIDAWPQRPAWRIFLHDEAGRKVLDDLRPGLH